MYPAEPLPSTGQLFRLLTLQPSSDARAPLVCRLQTCSLDEEFPPYTALSYAWGKQHAEKAIMCNGAMIPINDNLEKALLICRSSHANVCFWVDQICVNQQDVLEKNHQVPRMGRIFKNAQSVLGWLGEPDETTSDLEQYASWVLGRSFFDGEVPFSMLNRPLDFNRRQNLDRGRRALVKLLQGRVWFKRSWIVQEAAAQRRKLRLQMGRYTFSYQSLLIIVLFTNDDIKAGLKHVPHKQPHPLGWRSVLSPLTFCPAIEMANNSQGLNKLSLLVSHFCSWGASDPRDKIYAFLALAFDADKYEPPDYDLSVETVYKQFASTTIMRGFSCMMPYLSFAAQSEPFPNQPSWVANWTTLEDETISLMRNNTGFRAGGSIKDIQNFFFDGETICLPGAVKGIVKTVSPAYRPAATLSGSFGHWFIQVAEHVRQFRRLECDGGSQLEDDHRYYESDVVYVEDIAKLLVLDGKSSLYHISGDEASHFVNLRQQAVDDPRLGDQPTAWNRFGNLTVGARCMPTHLPVHDLRALITPEGAFARSLISSPDNVTSQKTVSDTAAPKEPGKTSTEIRPDTRDSNSTSEPVTRDNYITGSTGTRGLSEYKGTVRAIALSQAVMTLEDGTLGLCNWKVKPGDVVAVLTGARLPFILRPMGQSGRYRLISEAYVRGMMFEAISAEREAGKLQIFAIS